MVDQYPPIPLFKRLTFIMSALFHRPNKCIFYSINHLTRLFKYQRNTNASWGKREFFNMANDLPFGIRKLHWTDRIQTVQVGNYIPF